MEKTMTSSAELARQKIRSDAAAMGIDEDFISDLVDTFYASIRAHPALGPVFNDNIGDWEPHLETMKRFWNSVALNSGTYSGKPMQVHMQVRGITRNQFPVWLGLFEQALRTLVAGIGGRGIRVDVVDTDQ